MTKSTQKAHAKYGLKRTAALTSLQRSTPVKEPEIVIGGPHEKDKD
jgi:hypothetical protein